MSQPPDITVNDPVVLGVAILGDSIASVARDGTGTAIASNCVEPADVSPDGAVTAVHDLVESAPFAVSQIVLACADPQVRAGFVARIGDRSAPWWNQRLSVVPMPWVLAEAARGAAVGFAASVRAPSALAVVALDRSGALVAGESLALVDATDLSVLGSTDVPGPTPSILEPAGQSALQTALLHLNASQPNSGAGGIGVGCIGVVCVGAGAEHTGVIDAVAAVTGLRVIVATAPAFAVAEGATHIELAADTRRIAPVVVGSGAAAPRAPGLRWWAIGGAIGVAALVCLVTLVALFTADAPRSGAPATVTVPGTSTEVTVTEPGDGTTETTVREQTITETQTTTERPTTETSTVTATVTETSSQTETVTLTEQTTVTETTTETATGRP